ncbi:helix-turn-helix transcriptional regulator [Paenibacillus soyae]|uniref:WYL domain-containing protein n=1 Tax=Paenibacillus soyae TaxID=2969249 RepID=A0A9X2S8S4_9BACL|nr:WYL domain-containing protein [Paenibacillus soyae]MCR2802763.1 WYL domain-containing protein [Paenibacillus soyae]
MKRSDRLMAILVALQQRSETAQALADKLEVSKRTILRDMQALSEIGIPLYAVSGPNGGFRLMDGYKLPPLHFDEKEALTILFALETVTKLKDSPFRQARYTAMDKIRATLPAAVLEQVEPVLGHLAIEIPERPQRAPHLESLLEYAAASAWVVAEYRSERRQSRLRIRPTKVYSAHGFWYCEAYSMEHGEHRTFRVDRFVQLEESAPPEEKGFAKAADTPVLQAPPIRIAARLTYRGALLAEQDTHVGHQVRQIDDEVWELEFDCPASEWGWAARFFYSMGPDATVLEPVMLRRTLHDMGRELRDKYAESVRHS